MKERLPRNRRHGLKKRESTIHAEKELKCIFLGQRLSPSREITTACQSLGTAARHVFGPFFGLDSVQLQLFFLPLLRKERPDLQTR